MKRRTVCLSLICTAMIVLASCTRTGRCHCVVGGFDVTTPETSYDNKQDYNEAKDACENNGCDFIGGWD